MGDGVRLLAGLIVLGLAGPASAADMPEPGYWPAPRPAPALPPPPRYFPRGDSDASPATRGDPACQGFVPTNAPGDPTYVGSPMELYKNPGNLFVARFIGSPSMNILPATVSRAGARTEVKLPEGHNVEVPVETPASAAGAKVHFGVRPEDLRVAREGEAVFLEGKVDYVEQLGEVQLVYLDIGLADEPLVVKLPGGAPVERGAPLRLTASAEDLHLFAEDGSSLRRPQLPVAA